MQDAIMKGNGNSRYLRSVPSFLSLYPTYEDFAQALTAGTLPIDLNGINADGWSQEGTPLNKANLLADATAALFALGADATPNEALNAAGTTINTNKENIASVQTALKNCGDCFVTWGNYTGNDELEKTLTFDRPPVMVVIWNRSNSASPYKMVLIRDCDRANGYGNSSSNYVTVIWNYNGNKNSVCWQHSANANAEFNKSGELYYYAAFLTAAEV